MSKITSKYHSLYAQYRSLAKRYDAEAKELAHIRAIGKGIAEAATSWLSETFVDRYASAFIHKDWRVLLGAPGAWDVERLRAWQYSGPAKGYYVFDDFHHVDKKDTLFENYVDSDLNGDLSGPFPSWFGRMSVPTKFDPPRSTKLDPDDRYPGRLGLYLLGSYYPDYPGTGELKLSSLTVEAAVKTGKMFVYWCNMVEDLHDHLVDALRGAELLAKEAKRLRLPSSDGTDVP